MADPSVSALAREYGVTRATIASNMPLNGSRASQHERDEIDAIYDGAVDLLSSS